jgi:hypothetical protein
MTRHAGGRGRTRGRTEGHSRSTNVRVHARLRDPKHIGDLFRRKTAGDCAQDLTLAVGQPGDCPRATTQNAPREEIAGKDPDHRGSRAMH